MKVFRVKTTVSILEKDSIELWEPATTKTSLAPFSIFINLFPFYYSPSCGSWNVWPESHWPSFQTCHGFFAPTCASRMVRNNCGEIYIITRVPWMKWGILLKPCHYDIVGWSMTLHTKGRFDDGHAYSFLPPKTTVLTSDFVGSDWVSIAKPQNIPSFTSFQARKPKGCR